MPATTTGSDRTIGLEDLARSVRALARSTRELGMEATQVVERELAMAIRISEDLRDQVIADQALERVRNDDLWGQFRKDAHTTVDLVMDASGLVALSALDFLERLADDRRPPLQQDRPQKTSAE